MAKRLGLMVLGLLSASASYAAAPKLTEVSRSSAAKDGPNTLRDEKGQPILVTVDSVVAYVLKITAKRDDGTALSSMKVAFPKGYDFLEGTDIQFNDLHDIVVLFTFRKAQSTAKTLLSNNLSTGKTVELGSAGEFISVLDHVRSQGHRLTAVSETGGNWVGQKRSTTLRIVDEESGQVLTTLRRDFPFSGKFGLDRKGKLKFLLDGYEMLGVLDMETNQFQELFPVNQQNQSYLRDVTLSIGTFHQYDDGKELRLFTYEDLFDGQAKPVQVFPSPTLFVGGNPPRFAAIHDEEGIRLTDLATGKPLGPKIRKQSLPANSTLANVVDVVEGDGRSAVVLSELVRPGTYTPGTILMYVDVKTGVVLRKRELYPEQLQAELVLGPTGTILSVERVQESGRKKGFQVIDVFKNKIITQSDTIEILGPLFRSTANALLALRGTEQNKVCVFNLLDLTQETCLADPLIFAEGIRYGYTPFKAETGKLTLPLLKPAPAASYTAQGFVEFQVD